MVNDYIKNNIGKWGRVHYDLFAVGYAEYLCNKHNLTLPSYVDNYKGMKMDKLLFQKGVLILNNYGVFLSRYENGLDEFKKYNLVLTIQDLEGIY